MAEETKMNELLYVAYYFPPLMAGGVARTEHNCKFLPTFSWKPTLLTVKCENSQSVDCKYDQMGIKVIRASGIINESKVRGRPWGTGKNEVSLKTRIQKLCANWMLLPDRQVLWKLPAQKIALKAAKKHDWKCVYATLHPITAAWIGKYIAKRLGLPFVLEYRDIINEMPPVGPPTEPHRKIVRRIEQDIVFAASKVVVVSPGIKDWFVNRHNIDHENIKVIETGFSPDDRDKFNALPGPTGNKFTMVYAGAFLHYRKPDTLLKAIRKLINSKRIPPEKIHVRLISNIKPSTISEFDLDGIVEPLPFCSRKEVLKWYAQSDMLLFICDKSNYQNVTYPGKLFEYLMTEKPILGLLEKNSVSAKVLENSGLGFLADADDSNEVATQIEKVYNQWLDKSINIEPNSEIIEQFNCLRSIERLSSIFDEITK